MNSYLTGYLQKSANWPPQQIPPGFEATPDEIQRAMKATQGIRQGLASQTRDIEGAKRLVQALRQVPARPALTGLGRVLFSINPVAAPLSAIPAVAQAGAALGDEIGNRMTPLSMGMSPQMYKYFQAQRQAVRKSRVDAANNHNPSTQV